jgi:2,3-dihydroxybiphenyl 1,2-dioxygenase
MMSRVKELGYVVFGVTDQKVWDGFLVDYLGLVRGNAEARPGGGSAYRIDDHAGRILVGQGQEDDIVALGVEVEGAAALEALRSHLEGLGHDVVQPEDDLARRRMVDDLLLVKDPDGNVIELHHTPRLCPEQPFRSSRVSSAFVTQGQGLGHAVLATTRIADMRRFYCEALGFEVSDYIDVPFGPGVSVEATFLHCNARHHTSALLAAPFPKRLVHFMLELSDVDDVGRLYCDAPRHGIELTGSLGRHTNDRMLSFYAGTPSGFEIEVGCDGLAIEPGQWSPVRYAATSVWGHERLKP